MTLNQKCLSLFVVDILPVGHRRSYQALAICRWIETVTASRTDGLHVYDLNQIQMLPQMESSCKILNLNRAVVQLFVGLLTQSTSEDALPGAAS